MADTKDPPNRDALCARCARPLLYHYTPDPADGGGAFIQGGACNEFVPQGKPIPPPKTFLDVLNEAAGVVIRYLVNRAETTQKASSKKRKATADRKRARSATSRGAAKPKKKAARKRA